LLRKRHQLKLDLVSHLCAQLPEGTQRAERGVAHVNVAANVQDIVGKLPA
jgi:hypothetical protein